MLDDTLIRTARFTAEDRAMIVAYYAPELGRGLVTLRREYDELNREELALVDRDGATRVLFFLRSDGCCVCIDGRGEVLAQADGVLTVLASLPRTLQRALALA